MKISPFNLEDWKASVKDALFNNDIKSVKSLRKAYNKPTVLLESFSELESSINIDNSNFLCEPRLQNQVEIMIINEYKKGVKPSWPWFKNVEIDITMQEVIDISKILKEEY